MTVAKGSGRPSPCARAHIGGAVPIIPLLAPPTQPWIEEGKTGDGMKSIEL